MMTTTTNTTTTTTSTRSLIVGGHQVLNANTVYPGFVWSGIGTDGWGCGGALIHSDIAISAAHCAVVSTKRQELHWS